MPVEACSSNLKPSSQLEDIHIPPLHFQPCLFHNKDLMLICLMRLVLELFLFISNLILLVLSCCINVSLLRTLIADAFDTMATCSAINRFTYIVQCMSLSTPINSASLELLVLIFYLQDTDINDYFPKVNTAPEWFLIYCVL